MAGNSVEDYLHELHEEADLPRPSRCSVPSTPLARTGNAMPIIHADRSAAAAAHLVRALEVLTQRRDGDTPHQSATVAELCRLTGVSRNSVYRYHPEILAALRRHQHGSAPSDRAAQSITSSVASSNSLLQDQVTRLNAL